ncbi:MAG: MFS transporter, partial [Paracoccaceae bacterium]|nr:MFS transporter [Paracoccaceae bacterium]
MMRAWKTGLFAAMLSAAGLPLYIHLPRFASAELGLSLTTVGAILIGIRFFDFIQDPLLGWLVDRRPQFKQSFAFSSAFGLALGFAMLFSVTPPIRADIWMILALVILFTAYSLATILLYGQSVALAEGSGPDGHFTIAGFREAGLIIGVILAAVSPSILAQFGFDPYRGFGLFLAAFCFLAWVSTRDLWSVTRISATQLRLSQLHSAGGTFLLVLALANALPVALTSTLFLFFVEDRLGLPEQAGLFLILFFAAAGLSAPLWSAAAKRFGARRVLLPAMVLSIIAFIGAASLPAEAAIGFSLICVASG